MSDYTPTTDEIELGYAERAGQVCGTPYFAAGLEFDRWLAEVKAAAWDEGYGSGHSNAMRRMSDEPNAPTTPNPYRT